MCVYHKETDVQRCPFGTTDVAAIAIRTKTLHGDFVCHWAVLSSPCFSLFGVSVRWPVATQTHLGGQANVKGRFGSVPVPVPRIWPLLSITGTGAGSAWRGAQPTTTTPPGSIAFGFGGILISRLLLHAGPLFCGRDTKQLPGSTLSECSLSLRS